MPRATYPRGGGQVAVCRPLHAADEELLAPCFLFGIDQICGEAWDLVMERPPRGPGLAIRRRRSIFQDASLGRTGPPGPRRWWRHVYNLNENLRSGVVAPLFQSLGGVIRELEQSQNAINPPASG